METNKRDRVMRRADNGATNTIAANIEVAEQVNARHMTEFNLVLALMEILNIILGSTKSPMNTKVLPLAWSVGNSEAEPHI